MSSSPFERWEEPAIRSPEPVDDPFFAGLFDQFRTIAADCRVVLSGEGADNLMHFEMWPFVRDMMRNQEWRSLLGRNSPLSLAAAFGFAGTQAARAETFRERSHCAIYPPWLAPDFARRLNLKDRAKEWSELPAFRPHPDSSQGPCLAFVAALVCRMFEQENPGVTRCPVEVRHPFLDLRIVNFLLALPPFPAIFREERCCETPWRDGCLKASVRGRRHLWPANPLLAHLRRLQSGLDGSDSNGTQRWTPMLTGRRYRRSEATRTMEQAQARCSPAMP